MLHAVRAIGIAHVWRLNNPPPAAPVPSSAGAMHVGVAWLFFVRYGVQLFA